MLDRYTASLVEQMCALPWLTAVDAWNSAFHVVVTLGGPRTARALGGRLGEHAGLRAPADCLLRMAIPLATLERFAGYQTRPDRYSGFGAWRDGSELARAGSDPEGLEREVDLLERFAAIDREVIEYLMATGWQTSLREAIELFVRAPRAPRAAGLVWGRAADPRSRLEVEPCFLDNSGALDLAGRPLLAHPDERVWIVHPAELDADRRAEWRAVQRVRAPSATQFERRLVLRDKPPSLSAVRKLVDPLPSPDALLARGFHRKTASTMDRDYRYRDVVYAVALDLPRQRIDADRPLPVVVLHELARDLVAATG